jgi:hypothetical protein
MRIDKDLHLAVKHAGETLYGQPAISHGALEGKRVFCSDMTFAAALNWKSNLPG